MSKKNFKVATTENGMTPKQDKKHVFATVNVKKDNTPTGNVKTLKDKEAIKKAREEQYINFRVNALKRRAKRMGLTDKQIEVKVEELKKQISAPVPYTILILFNKNDVDMVKQAMLNEGLDYNVMSNSHVIMDGDKEVLDTIRKIMPPSAKIHPYAKKKPPVLPWPEPVKAKAKPKTKTEKKTLAAAAKKARKSKALSMHTNHKLAASEQKSKRTKKQRRAEKAHKLFQKRCKKRSGTVVQLNTKKASNAAKKASTTIKKAA